MDELELTQLLKKHNRNNFLWGVLSAAVSLIFWCVAYAVAALFVFLILIFVFHTKTNRILVHGISLGVMLLLLIEGIRCREDLFDIDNARYSFYTSIDTALGGLDFSRYRCRSCNIFRGGYIISQILLCAPRSTLAAWSFFRGMISVNPNYLRVALECFYTLGRENDWMKVSDFGDRSWALKYLDAADLLWFHMEKDQVQVKIDPSAQIKYLDENRQ